MDIGYYYYNLLQGEGFVQNCPKCGHRFKTKNDYLADAANKARVEHPNAFKQWSIAEDLKLKGLVTAGEDLLEISQQLGRQPSAVKKRMELFNFVLKPKIVPQPQPEPQPEVDYLDSTPA